MKRGSRGAWMVAVLVALVPAAAAGASPQEAARLEAEAAALGGSREELARAAELYRRAAALRPDGDPVGLRDLIRAGRLAWYAGERTGAVRELESAAATVLRFGDVMTAATVFMDAAWMSNQIGDGEGALRLANRALDLSRSPLLADADRERIRGRVESALTG